nr:MAG TPA_asm: type I membrane glycoprotein [Caudoviricetes sp.]
MEDTHLDKLGWLRSDPKYKSMVNCWDVSGE